MRLFLGLLLLGTLALPERQAAALAAHPHVIPLGNVNSSAVQPGGVGGGATTTGGAAFFAGKDSEHGTEVWRYSGGTATLFADERPGAESSNPEQFTAVGNDAIWVANDGVRGPEIHSSYSISPFSPLIDLQPGASHPAPQILGSMNGCVWFSTPSWDGPKRLTILWAMTSIGNPVEVGRYQRDSMIQVSTVPNTTRLFFVARPAGTDPRHQLFTVKGTQTAQLIANLDPSGSGAIPPAQSYAATPTFVCFREVSGSFGLRVQNLSSGVISTLPATSGSTVLPWFATNGIDRVCFAGGSASAGVELWTTLGTVATTALLADLASGASSSNPSRLMMSPGNPGVFFQIDDATTRDLYFINPLETPAPVARKLRDSVQTSTQFAIVDADEIALGVPDGSITSIWLADGKYGTGQWIGPTFSSVNRLWNANSAIPPQRQLNVVATTAPEGEELYRLSNSTLSLLSLNNIPGASAGPRGFFQLGVDQMFVADTHAAKDRLFRLSSSGPQGPITMEMPPDVGSSNASSFPADFTECSGLLLFTASNGTQRQMYWSDGKESSAGHVVSGIYEPEQLVKFQDRVFMLGYATAGGTGVKQLFQAQIDSGSVAVTTFDTTAHPATALIAAAGKLFFVEPTFDGQEKLQCILPDFTLPPAPKFYLDASGIGITQLTASSGHVYFTAREFNHPSAKRVLWGADGAFAGPTVLSAGATGIENPQLLGALDDRCIFWRESPNGYEYDGFSWDADMSGPLQCGGGPLMDAPEPNRLARQAAGVELGDRFYFTTKSGKLLSTDGNSVSTVYFDSGSVARPESLAVLGDRLLFLTVTAANNCRLYSYSMTEGVRTVKTFSDLTLPCPLQNVGGRLYFTIAELNYNIGHPDLWRTDGTQMGTELVLHDIASRETASIPMGVYRGHLVMGAEQSYASQGIEPALLNLDPRVFSSSLTGARKEQPFTFTYAQIVSGGAVDDDGDVLLPFFITSWSSSLKKNGTLVPTTTTTEIVPGDVFEWTPAADDYGFVQPLTLGVWDEWNLGTASILIRVETAHDEWTRQHFTPGELADPLISGPTADPDADGVSNAMEFVFGREPTQCETEPPWQFAATPEAGGLRHIQYTFTRLATLPPGTDLAIDSSTDLVYWTAMTTKFENEPWGEGGNWGVTVTESALPDGRVQVSVGADVPVEPGTFLRLRVNLP